MLARPASQRLRRLGLDLLLDWLTEQPGDTWQQRWLASGADTAGVQWRQITRPWLAATRNITRRWGQETLSAGLLLAICADVLRPGLAWLAADTTGNGGLARRMTRWRDPAGFARLRQACHDNPHVSKQATSMILRRGAVIAAAKGGVLADVTVGDMLELFDLENRLHASGTNHTTLTYQTFHRMGIFDAAAPDTLRELRGTGQRTPAELIDRYQLTCQPVRDLIVDYLCERQPALDYGSLEALAGSLGKLFWQDLERHHPGIDSLRLPAEVAHAWKQRLRVKTTRTLAPSGEIVERVSSRLSFHESLVPIRAFYLDLAQWALEDPARWGPWVAPCPIKAEETIRGKNKRQHKSRMDARTRQRLPVLPVLVDSVNQRRKHAHALLEAARRTEPGHTFTVDTTTLRRPVMRHTTGIVVWAEELDTGKRRDLGKEEAWAFWAWATVEVLRATGIRIEELLELSHHSLVQYRLPTTGEIVPLLQIAPSKTDAERLLVVSPELADVLSTIIRRVRDTSGKVPAIRAYDYQECVWLPPSPRLFQRPYTGENRPIGPDAIRAMLTDALAHTGLTDPATGGPLHFTPHDFRRIFITDAIRHGLPPHIAQVIVGHRDINVTMGYKAVYADEAVQAHLAFLARRRALRPSDEYRTPTDAEWQEFLGHFQRRKASTGICARAFGASCEHEHACIRCAMLWPDPAQRPRLAEIRDNLIDRIAEAEREGWLGEVDGLKVSLAGAEQKLAQIDARANK